jgi:Flp pilus assembly protein TadG
MRGDHGVAMVEFALLLPFLAIITIGLVDFGRWYRTWNQVKNASREGAVYAQTHPHQQRATGSSPCNGTNSIEARAEQEVGVNASDATFNVKITPDIKNAPYNDSDGCANTFIVPSGTEMTVVVTRDMTLFTPLMSNIVGPIKVSAKVTTVVQG